MINDYSEYKHKCVLMPFEEFRAMMNTLTGARPSGSGILGEADSYGTLWSFWDYELSIQHIPPEFPYNNVTYADIADYLNIGNIEAIFCKDPKKYDVIIIYD